VSLYWHAQAIETLLPGGKRNPAAGIMLALLAEMARNETETLRERIKSGQMRQRAHGSRAILTILRQIAAFRSTRLPRRSWTLPLR
jgi:DNA invertase Pin-like site-specific DNA recombinase